MQHKAADIPSKRLFYGVANYNGKETSQTNVFMALIS